MKNYYKTLLVPLIKNLADKNIKVEVLNAINKFADSITKEWVINIAWQNITS